MHGVDIRRLENRGRGPRFRTGHLLPPSAAQQSKAWSQRDLLSRRRSFPPNPKPPPVEITSNGTVDLSISFEWRHHGWLRLDAGGGLTFPPMDRAPGLYRFRLAGGDGERRHIGETENLQRRFHHYRNPDPSQMTNMRLNKLFVAHLASGEQIGMDVLTDGAQVTVAAVPLSVDLADKATRRLLEYAAIVAEAGTEVGSLNL